MGFGDYQRILENIIHLCLFEYILSTISCTPLNHTVRNRCVTINSEKIDSADKLLAIIGDYLSGIVMSRLIQRRINSADGLRQLSRNLGERILSLLI